MTDPFRRRSIAALFLLSGFAAMLYQTVWIKRLSLQFGHSAWSIATVVGVFMAGLGLGSWISGRFADRLRHPIRLYGWIEFGVALFGLLTWPLLNIVPTWLAPVYGTPHLFPLLRLAVCFLMLLPPTILMGASLPVLVVGVAERGTFERAVGWFYGINTLGSAIGVAFAGFLLLPELGVRATLLIAVLIGFIVAGVALALSKGYANPTTLTDDVDVSDRGRFSLTIPLLALTCGFFGLFLEIAWARLLAPVLGSSIYTFSLVLLVILAGTALGSLAVSRYSWSSARNFSISCGLLALAGAIGLLGLPLVNAAPTLFVRLASLTENAPTLFFVVQALIVTLVAAGPTLALGMALPCLVNAHRGEASARGRSLAIVYAFNTLGAIGGCFITGFWLLPFVGVSTAVIAVCAGILILSALFFASTAHESIRRRGVVGGTIALACVAVVLWWPRINLHRLHTGFFRAAMRTSTVATPSGDLIFIKDGISCTVTVYRSPNQTQLKVNGKTDASTGGDLATQYLVGHLSMMFHANPKRVCVIGYGSGATVRAVMTHDPISLDVVELEPAVVDASPYFQFINESTLDDPRVHLRVEDGRTFLGYGKGLFDVIVSEPSNPWIAGVSSLFTREFYLQARSRLANDGIFCQWIQTYELSTPTLYAMISTLGETFPYVSIFAGNGDLICVASNRPLAATSAMLAKRMQVPAVKRNLAKIGVTNVFDLLLGYYGRLPEGQQRFASSQRNTDDNSWLEYRAPLEMYAGHVPSLAAPSIPEVFEEYATRFFSDISRSQLAIGLAESIVRMRPFASYRIEKMLPLFEKSATRDRLEASNRSAIARNEALRTIDETIARAVQLMNAGHTAEAYQSLDAMAKIAPHYPGLQRWLGMVCMRSEKWEKAQLHFDAALADNPTDFLTLSELGSGWLSHGNVPAAIACFKRAVEANPIDRRSQELLSSLLSSQPPS